MTINQVIKFVQNVSGISGEWWGDKDQPHPLRRIIQKSDGKQTCPPITYIAKFISSNFPSDNYKIKSRVRRALMTCHIFLRMKSLEILNVPKCKSEYNVFMGKRSQQAQSIHHQKYHERQEIFGFFLQSVSRRQELLLTAPSASGMTLTP